MADGCALDPVSGGKTLYVGTVDDYSEKSWRVTQSDGQSAYVAKSQTVVFERATESVGSPQQALDAFAGDSR
jgi:hypothetical protein